MNRRRFTFAALSLALLSATACGFLGNNYPPYRYRLTVEVDTPEGVKTGSSVLEVRIMQGYRNMVGAGGATSKARGEAVAVDLGPRGTMFALLTSAVDQDWAGQAMESVTTPVADQEVEGVSAGDAGTKARLDIIFARIMATKGAQLLPRKNPEPGYGQLIPDGRADNYPQMVRFRDIRDPKSVEAVDTDDLAKSFGPGVTLKRITVQITDDPVTVGIRKRLAWLENVGKTRATLIPDPPRILANVKEPGIQLLGPSAFSTELYQ